MKPLKAFGILVLTIVLASAWGCGSTAKTEGTGEYVDDSVITTKVKAAIFNDSTLKVNEINVETFKGVVRLTGFVRSQTDINKAVQIARDVAGVKSVKNDMQIKMNAGGLRCERVGPLPWARSWEQASCGCGDARWRNTWRRRRGGYARRQWKVFGR